MSQVPAGSGARRCQNRGTSRSGGQPDSFCRLAFGVSSELWICPNRGRLTGSGRVGGGSNRVSEGGRATRASDHDLEAEVRVVHQEPRGEGRGRRDNVGIDHRHPRKSVGNGDGPMSQSVCRQVVPPRGDG